MTLKDTGIKRLSFLKGDAHIWTIVMILCFISLIEVFSASSRMVFGRENYMRPIIGHAAHLCLGLGVMYLFHIIHYKWYRLLPFFLVPASIAALAILSFSGGGAHGSAQRWIDLGFINLQPSEIAKMAVILTVAAMLEKLKPNEPLSQSNTFWKIVVLTGFFFLLIFTENLSTALILCMTVYFMMIIGGISKKIMIWFSISCVGVGIFLMLLLVVPSAQTLKSIPFVPDRALTWRGRILDFAGSSKESKQSPREYVYEVAPDKPQETHANIAIASSHFLGKGPGKSQERDNLQEASCDFIFAIILEELGLVGGMFVMFLYLLLFYRVWKISNRCTDKYPAYVACGIGVMLGLQAFVNMSVAVGLFPVTGQPLPLISKGGTSVLVCSAYIGMLLGISRVQEEEEEKAQMAADTVVSEQPDEQITVSAEPDVANVELEPEEFD